MVTDEEALAQEERQGRFLPEMPEGAWRTTVYCRCPPALAFLPAPLSPVCLPARPPACLPACLYVFLPVRPPTIRALLRLSEADRIFVEDVSSFALAASFGCGLWLSFGCGLLGIAAC